MCKHLETNYLTLGPFSCFLDVSVQFSYWMKIIVCITNISKYLMASSIFFLNSKFN